MSDARHHLGAAGEDAALQLYLGQGYRLVARNWRCRMGELDLVLARGSQLVICEVKTRRGSRFGHGWEAVDARKRAKLRAVAEAFLLAHPVRNASVRFDVASVSVRDARPPSSAEVELFQDAF